MAHPEGLAADRAQEPRPGQASRTEPLHHQRHTLETAVWCAVARRTSQIRGLEHHLSDCKAYDALIVLPERTPDALLADKGYDADAIRADLAKRNIDRLIPGRSNRQVKIEHDRALYKLSLIHI